MSSVGAAMPLDDDIRRWASLSDGNGGPLPRHMVDEVLEMLGEIGRLEGEVTRLADENAELLRRPTLRITRRMARPVVVIEDE